ncbi:hypothetical protein [Tateyamaria sp. SN3-11]|uniref:hypothetical protein n=1 Tax=Tateyamaria sp. SN3-11 TaxID=3092147 RepID=UPI0039E7F7B7
MQAVAQFSNFVPLREQIDVLVSARDAYDVSRTIAKTEPKKRVFELHDHTQVASFVSEAVDKVTKGRFLNSFRKVFDGIVSVSWTPPNVDSGSFEISLLNGISAEGLDLPEYMLIKRDGLEPNHLTGLFALFEKIPPKQRPKIILDAELDLTSAYELLSCNVERVRVFTSKPGGLEEIELRNQDVAHDNFLKFYEASALGSCAAADLFEEGMSDAQEEDARTAIVQQYLKVQALKRLGNKFEAIRPIKAALDAMHNSQNLDERWKSQALFFFLIDLAYTLEDPKCVEQLTGIALRLENQKMIGHAYRMVNLSAGISPFSSQRLMEGDELFRSLGEPVGQLYCRNNLLVTNSHLLSHQTSRRECEKTLEFAFEVTPFSDRLSTVCSSVGVAHLLNNDLSEAQQAFSRGTEASGLRFHQLTARVNQLICEYVADGKVSERDVEDCTQAIEASRMSAKLDYHHTYLLGNLHALAPSKHSKNLVADQLISRRFLDYSDDEVRAGDVLAFVEKKLRMLAPDGSFSGPKGEFFRRYGLLPLNHFVWN